MPASVCWKRTSARSCKVSRAPVREALRILERERLVEFQARRGAIVTAPDARDLRDIYVVRVTLYGVLLRQLMEECPAKLDAVFERHIPKLKRAAEDSVDAYALASFLLNMDVFQLCSNRLLVDTLVSISLRTLRYVRIGLAANPESIPGSVEDLDGAAPRRWQARSRAGARNLGKTHRHVARRGAACARSRNPASAVEAQRTQYDRCQQNSLARPSARSASALRSSAP